MPVDLFDANLIGGEHPQGEGYSSTLDAVGGTGYQYGASTKPIETPPDIINLEGINWVDIWIWQGGGFDEYNVPRERFVLRRMTGGLEVGFEVNYQIYFTEKTGDNQWTDRGVYPQQFSYRGSSVSSTDNQAKSGMRDYLIYRYRPYAWGFLEDDEKAMKWAENYVDNPGVKVDFTGVGMIALIAIIGIMFLG